jgi:hypothetical protein
MLRFWAILATMIPASLAAAEPEPEPVARPAVRWQYAELQQRQSGAVAAAADDGTRTPGKLVISWNTSSGKASADGWEEMAKKLKAPTPGKDAEPNHRLRVLDRLGAEGWELVGTETATTPVRAAGGPGGGRGTVANRGTTWLFKRRLEK